MLQIPPKLLFFQVVVLCSMLWALPPIWPFYKISYYLYWSRYLYPTAQIALMSSVYCTIVMSWERYVQICLVARLKKSYYLYFGDRKFCLYIVFIVMFPIIFYIPKFFEVSTENISSFSHYFLNTGKITDYTVVWQDINLAGP